MFGLVDCGLSVQNGGRLSEAEWFGDCSLVQGDQMPYLYPSPRLVPNTGSSPQALRALRSVTMNVV